jgi:hypothetical protein
VPLSDWHGQAPPLVAFAAHDPCSHKRSIRPSADRAYRLPGRRWQAIQQGNDSRARAPESWGPGPAEPVLPRSGRAWTGAAEYLRTCRGEPGSTGNVRDPATAPAKPHTHCLLTPDRVPAGSPQLKGSAGAAAQGRCKAVAPGAPGVGCARRAPGAAAPAGRRTQDGAQRRPQGRSARRLNVVEELCTAVRACRRLSRPGPTDPLHAAWNPVDV